MSIRKAIGTVKDQTSISIAKVASNTAPDLEVAIVKATSHEDDPPSEKHVQEILRLTSLSQGYVQACVSAVSKRLGRTRDWIVAVKTLMLVHRLVNEGGLVVQEEIVYATTRKGTRLLNLSEFRDEAHSNAWDHSSFVRSFAMYLDQRLEYALFNRKCGRSEGKNGDEMNGKSGTYGEVSDAHEGRKPVTSLVEFKPQKIFEKMGQLQRLLDRFLSCKPAGLTKKSRLILAALYPVVEESFQLHAEICETLSILIDMFFAMEYSDCVKAVDSYASAAKQIDEFIVFYNLCKEMGVAGSSTYPEVHRISPKLLETLAEFVRDRAMRPKSPNRREVPLPVNKVEEVFAPDVNEIKMLPPPKNYTPPPSPPKPEVPEVMPQMPQVIKDLVNLRDDVAPADNQGNKSTLAFFNGPPGIHRNCSWEAFSSNTEPQATSTWQNPAVEPGKADWEVTLVETASNMSKQKTDMGGGLDPLLLSRMYDRGMVRQHVTASQLSEGSASSVALLGIGKSATQVLALPAPNGTVQVINQDPFAASSTVLPPSYVQMADIEKKQNLVVQERMAWQQYAENGMQGQASLNGINNPMAMTPHRMSPTNGMATPDGYYYTPY